MELEGEEVAIRSANVGRPMGELGIGSVFC